METRIHTGSSCMMMLHNFLFTFEAALLIVLSLCAPSALAEVIIDNGSLIQLGINSEGHLNVPGGTPSMPASPTTVVGLRYIPTNADAVAPGCLCEGWGVANADAGTTTFASYANISADGVIDLIVEPGTGLTATTGQLKSDSIGTAFKSIARTANGRLRVIHDFQPSTSPNLYEVTVTIENIGSLPIGDLRYRRVMDWDIAPDTFNEFVEIHVGGTPELLRANTDGFASANPLSILPPDVGSPPTTLTSGSPDYFSGPEDQGALFDFQLGTLSTGASRTFRIYYGAAKDRSEALAAITAVASEVYSFGIPTSTLGTAGTDGPHVFIFAASFGPVFSSPLQSPRITQDFSCYNCFKVKQAKPFHTGIDMVSKMSSTTNTIISAAAIGTVHAIYFSQAADNRICDLNNSVNDLSVRTVVTNLKDPIYQNLNLGNVVIIDHGQNVFSLYAHLECIERNLVENFLNAVRTNGDLPDVAAGHAIGRMGGSGLKDLSTYHRHLHFEIKVAGVLNAPSSPADAGYTSQRPDSLGYYDPILFLIPDSPSDLDPTVTVKTLQNNVNVRPGPAYDDVFLTVSAGTELVSFRTANVGGSLWHQVHLAVPVSNIKNCGQSTSPAGGVVCNNDGHEGWISGNLLETISPSIKIKISANQASIFGDQNGAIGKTIIAYAFASQEFIVTATRVPDKRCSKTWYKIYLGNIRTPSQSTQGWICGTFLAT